jgi:hypothetical protein
MPIRTVAAANAASCSLTARTSGPVGERPCTRATKAVRLLSTWITGEPVRIASPFRCISISRAFGP